MRFAAGLISLVWCVPFLVDAAVTINEVAWMGSADSANAEWIELYNDGTDVVLDGWTLSDGGSLAIELTGTLGANEYAVLERTSDASAPGTAFLIYTGALKNSGATLSLRRADDGLEDQVSGGEDWSNIGGDNTTKETAQYTTSGWVTGVATPGAVNVSQVQTTSEPEVESDSEPATVKKSSGGSPLIMKLPGNTLELDVIAPAQVFVEQAVSFDVLPSGVGEVIADSLQYEWNFGDMHTARTQAPTHTFKYPGTYVVRVTAAYGTQETTVIEEITVLPVTVSLTTNVSGDIQIHNDSPYTIDLSEYRLRAGTGMDIPAGTWLLDRQTITVPKAMVQANAATVVGLYDPVGQLVASILPAQLQRRPAVDTPTLIVTPVTPLTPPEPVSEDRFRFVPQAEAAPVVDTPQPMLATNQAPGTPSSSQSWPLLALVVLLFVVCVVVLMQPLAKPDSLDRHE